MNSLICTATISTNVWLCLGQLKKIEKRKIKVTDTTKGGSGGWDPQQSWSGLGLCLPGMDWTPRWILLFLHSNTGAFAPLTWISGSLTHCSRPPLSLSIASHSCLQLCLRMSSSAPPPPPPLPRVYMWTCRPCTPPLWLLNCFFPSPQSP